MCDEIPAAPSLVQRLKSDSRAVQIARFDSRAPKPMLLSEVVVMRASSSNQDEVPPPPRPNWKEMSR
jgi:hypothetical protein